MVTIINLFASLLITLGMTFFIIGVFGRKSESIEKLTVLERLLLRVSLCATAAGALYNLLSLSTPPVSELVLNSGMGLLFTWAAWFHWKYFVKKNR